MSSPLIKIIEPKLLRIIQLFLDKYNELFHLKKISTDSKVPLGTTFRLIKKLIESGLIDTVKVGNLKLYKTNKKAVKKFIMLKK